MNDEPVRESTDSSQAITAKDGDRKSVLTQIGRKAAPEEREALLKIGTDLLEALSI